MYRSGIFVAMACICLCTEGFGQKIGKKKPPQVSLTKYNSLFSDGDVVVDLYVRMADCISHVELVDHDYEDTKKLKVKLEDYYVKNEKTNAIYVKIKLGRLKEILRKRQEAYPELVVYSKTGKTVYQAPLAINRIELVSQRMDY
jgi:hypothetical protein